MRESRYGTIDSLEQGLHATLRLVADPGLDGVTGRYFDGTRPARALDQAYDPAFRARLRERTEACWLPVALLAGGADQVRTRRDGGSRWARWPRSTSPTARRAGVLSRWSIIHTPPPEVPAILAEFHRLLTPGGHHAPSAEQQQDLDFLLAVGHLFALIVYGQLILEQAELTGLDDALLDEIFAILIKDLSAYATEVRGKSATTDEQAARALAHLRRPVSDGARTAEVWRRGARPRPG